jgi:hypothetical protein
MVHKILMLVGTLSIPAERIVWFDNRAGYIQCSRMKNWRVIDTGH